MAAVGSVPCVDDLIGQTSACVLQPKCLFVSWNGVLTLVYRGFPPCLTKLKSDVSSAFPGLPKENPGSLWPKTSLAALKDKCRLTPDQLQQLNNICRDVSEGLTAIVPEDLTVLVENLSVVVYECRSLERKISKKTIPLQMPADLSIPSEEQLQNAERVVAESADKDYWFFASRDGSRESHYQGTGMGVTLAHELAAFSSVDGDGKMPALKGVLRKFRERVEKDLPGMYTWFAEESLHVTIRGLIG
ncbi:hypothetical protein BSKO_07536 [Bryopsis sp. KO-2023]|nr:hypothetical protein BSKO_07536 [Bryopsis sp. KO-2023]